MATLYQSNSNDLLMKSQAILNA